MYSFDEILKLLPDCDKFSVREQLPPGTNYVESEISGFVPPDLSFIEEDVGVQFPSVLIISAAGAVGKSTLAKVLAYRKGALLWDLASAQEVGANSLDGMLFNTYGEELGTFCEFLKEGLQFLIVDALDEGRFKVNERAFRRLLENIGNLAKGAEGICFVLLGRTQIAEEAWLVLSEEEVSASIASIEPFDVEQANSYIDNFVEQEKRTPPFYECRDIIFKQLAFSVTEREFLHYPPVLDVVVRLLKDEDNLIRLKNNLLAESEAEAQDRSVYLLQRVIDHILERDKQKVLPSVRETLQPKADSLGWCEWESLYTPQEQCKRLIRAVTGANFSVLPESLPQDLRTDYEEQIATWLSVHPFLMGASQFANSVFQSYLYARAIRSDFGEDVRNAVAGILLQPDNLPMRLLAEFYLETSDEDAMSPREIMPEYFGILYDSLLSSESSRNYLQVNIEGSDPHDSGGDLTSDVVEGEFEIWPIAQDAEFPLKSIPFSIPLSRNSKITFSGQLRNAFITVPCIVELGNNAKELHMGPAVGVSANVIRILSDTVFVRGKSSLRPDEEESSVILEALKCESQSVVNRPIVYGNGDLSVIWPEAEQFPWTDFRAERIEETINVGSSALHEAFMRFRGIARHFRSHKRGSLARTHVKIDDERVLRGPVGAALLQQLLNDGILTLSAGFYHWMPDKADLLLGVSWVNLSKGECPNSLREYLSGFVNKNSSLF